MLFPTCLFLSLPLCFSRLVAAPARRVEAEEAGSTGNTSKCAEGLDGDCGESTRPCTTSCIDLLTAPKERAVVDRLTAEQQAKGPDK